MKKFDAVVVGSGTGGSIAAKTVANQGFTVCMIDQKPKSSIGDKVCGDAVGKHHFDINDIDPPKGDELSREIKGVMVYSPDMFCIDVIGEGLHGFMINRLEFGQRLLNEAVDAGAELYDRTTVLEPIIKNNFVVGVEAKNQVDKKNVRFLGSIIIDCSGLTSVLRKKIPETWIERDIEGKDVVICYREIREVSSNIDDPDYIKLYLNQQISPGGYYWIFPKEENTVNVGLGVQMKENFQNPKSQLYQYVLSKPFFEGSQVKKAGGGIVSTRRPIGCLVGNGIMFVGDSAFQPNPIHGGGIGPSLMAGKLAAEEGCKAIEKGIVTKEELWPYSRKFMYDYGAKSAGLDVFRLFLQKCTDEDLNYGMKNRLIKEEDILKANMGEDLKLNITEKTRRVFRGFRKLGFLRALDKTSKIMKNVKSLYKQYTPPEKYSMWIKKIGDNFQEIHNLEF